MVGSNKIIQKTTIPCGVFRQPRQDILQDSVSQCGISQDSLCKVSDFEISIHSKYNLPDLYNVDGKGRAVYWLYKHSLADSESVRNSKTKSETVAGDGLVVANSTDATVLSRVKHEKLNFVTKGRKMKRKLCKLRDIFLSSAISDIEIKETYNSYINLDELETVGLLLKDNEDLCVDKYNNLIMNLELRKNMLEKKQVEKDKRTLTDSLRAEESHSHRYHLEKYLETIRNGSENVKNQKIKKNKQREKEVEKTQALACENAGADMLKRSGLELNELDHILNQMKFFLQSEKFTDVTEAQKTKLEEYLRLLTNASHREHVKRELCRGSIRRKLKENIRVSLRDVVCTKGMNRTSSLAVETDSDSDMYESLCENSVKQCHARAAINVRSCITINPIISDDEGFTGSYHTIHSSLTKGVSEKEIKCQDLRRVGKVKKDIKERNTSDNLVCKGYHLDGNDDLFNISKIKKSEISDRKSKLEENKKEKLEKFKAIKEFDEADTFKSLKMKQKEKAFKDRVKHSPKSSNHNISVAKAENVSYSGELDKKKEDDTPTRSKLVTQTVKDEVDNQKGKSKQNRSNSKHHKEDAIEAHALSNKLKAEERKKLQKVTSKSSLKPYKRERVSAKLGKADKKSSSKIFFEESKLNNCVCFKEALNASSDSGNDFKKSDKLSSLKLKVNNKLKSNSFPKSDLLQNLSNTLMLDVNQNPKTRAKIKERKRREKRKKAEDKDKITQSENCIENQIGNIKIMHRHIKREKELKEEEHIELDVKQPVEEKKKIREMEKPSEKNECKLSSNINGPDESNAKDTSYPKKRKSPAKIEPHTNDQDESKNPPQITEQEVINDTPLPKPKTYLTRLTKSSESAEALRSNLVKNESASNHVIQINNSLIHLDERNIFRVQKSVSLETFLKSEVLGKLHNALVSNENESLFNCSVNIPIYKQGFEIARITRQSPSCAYTIEKQAKKINKSTQMFEHVTRNDLYTLQWIHDNLFEIHINPHTLIVDETVNELSELSSIK